MSLCTRIRTRWPSQSHRRAEKIFWPSCCSPILPISSALSASGWWLSLSAFSLARPQPGCSAWRTRLPIASTGSPKFLPGRSSLNCGGLLFIGLLLLGRNIISLISGPEYIAAYPLLLLLGAATIISLAGLGLEPLLQAAGRAQNALGARVAGLIALGGLLAVFLPGFGTIGAAWVMLISAILTTLILFFSSRAAIRHTRRPVAPSPIP